MFDQHRPQLLRDKRILQIIFTLFLVANTVEIIDKSGLAGDHSAIASAAQATRTLLSGDLPAAGPLQELEKDLDQMTGLVGRVAEAFGNAARALE